VVKLEDLKARRDAEISPSANASNAAGVPSSNSDIHKAQEVRWVHNQVHCLDPLAMLSEQITPINLSSPRFAFIPSLLQSNAFPQIASAVHRPKR
jgi:hypothetical protein